MLEGAAGLGFSASGVGVTTGAGFSASGVGVAAAAEEAKTELQLTLSQSTSLRS